MGAAVIAIGGLALGWITIEMACKPCLEKGRRDAIHRNFNPDYDPDDDQNNAPLNPNPNPHPTDDDSTSTVVLIS